MGASPTPPIGATPADDLSLPSRRQPPLAKPQGECDDEAFVCSEVLEIKIIPELAQRYSVEVLNTTKGLCRGCWGVFKAAVFYRPLPKSSTSSDSDIQIVRHICIKALDICRYAEREGEPVDVEHIGEGSYANVYGVHQIAAKIISDRERPWVHKAAVENGIEADRLDLGPRIFGHGTLEQHMGGYFKGTVIFQERLDPLGDDPLTGNDIQTILSDVKRLSQSGFHNDLKLPNVLRRKGRPVLIDFDLMAEWTVKIAVTSSCIERDFRSLLEPLGVEIVVGFREYYNLFSLSLTLPDGAFYRAVFDRLLSLWDRIETSILSELLKSVGEDKMLDIPYEVLIRVPLHGISVNLLDLRGNWFAHICESSQSGQTQLSSCAHLPQLLRSNGVYWPEES